MTKLLLKKTAALAAAVFIILNLSACEKSTQISKSALKLDTVVTITVYGSSDGAVIDLAFDEIDRLQGLLDAHDSGSEIYKLGECSGESWVEVSDETAEVLALAKSYYELSGGYFDVTSAPIVELWNVTSGGYYPEKSEIEQALNLTDGSKLLLDGNMAYLSQKGMKVDLGGIAKGYIADKVKKLLQDNGVEHGIIDLGGNILTVGGKSNEADFTIGVQDPLKERGTILMKVAANDISLVSSGIYERYFEYDGKIYHHIIDPFTGAPSESDLSGATVISSQSVDGDALSTICILLGSEKALELIENLEDVEAVLVTRDGETILSSGMNELIIE